MEKSDGSSKSGKRKRGRPPFEPTAAQRRTVAISAGGGMSHEQIALTLGIDRATLVKHFGEELSIGAAKARQEVVMALHRQAKKGQVSAVRAYLAIAPQYTPPPGAPAGQEPSAPAPQAEAVKPAEPLGKKEQANAAAVTAQQGTDWEQLLPGPGGASPTVTH